ncbi:membrane-bound alkaline phosphatase-like [Anopheles ziemanni]|uniref:membrane-bound alkaline phosphatase-like n=1 Tax=Anopheles coustani TaxID=139045 RepID=UPI002659EDB9|nr:membrane-bound alkaline phosphatase-like [Anopheles coustani]XP_058176835.1 membrane-bound alkaline phosphatase-like [Anopheles ziemanni]
MATVVLLVAFAAFSAKVEAHEEHDAHHWKHMAHELLFEKKDYTMQKINVAKNIMVFVGSGMSQPTVTAARFYNGGDNETFSFERLKWSGNARTYCVNSRVPDPACAGTAFLTGVKSNLGTVAMDPTVNRGACELDPAKKLASIAKWALDAGKAVGFATTSRVTSGSNAALFANSPDSRWENDADVKAAGCNVNTVPDIAHQLIHGDIGKHFKVILGGGRKNFIPTTETDTATGARGLRTDGKNLIKEWQDSKQGANATYITTNSQLGALDTSQIDFLLGLFDFDNLPYSTDIESDTPPLVRMVHYSLEMLQKKEHTNGFLLFVEDGNIRRAHQENKVRKALEQVRHYSGAFNMAHMMGSEQNTLFVSLNDVGSTLALPGYPARSTDPVSSTAGTSDADALPYLGLAYATGPAHSSFYRTTSGRLDPTVVLQGMPEPFERTCPASVPMAEGADGGEDAAVYASGPWAFMLSGGYEQHFIAHQIAFASCMDGACDGASAMALSMATVVLALVAKLCA